jgi:hypothetical protein
MEPVGGVQERCSQARGASTRRVLSTLFNKVADAAVLPAKSGYFPQFPLDDSGL